MKILHVVRGLPNLSGTTHIVGPLAEAQARLGAKVSLLSAEVPNAPAVIPDASLVKSEVLPLSLPLYNPGVSLPFARAINSILPEQDVVHIHAIWNFPTWYTMRQSAKRGIPFMVAPQGSFEPWAMAWKGRRKALYARLLELPAMKKASRMQALSQAEADQIRANGVKVPAAFIPNGIDLRDFDKGERQSIDRFNWPEAQQLILSLSRLDPKKGIDLLIKGFAGFIKKGGLAELVIAGGDKGSGYGDEMKELARSTGVSERIHFVGEVRGGEKLGLLDRVDAFALISHSEGLPVAAVEAMAASLPVLITPGCNIPDVRIKKAGIIVETDVAQVTQALGDLLGQQYQMRRMGANGRALVEEKFTWPKIAEQTMQVYGEMIRESEARP